MSALVWLPASAVAGLPGLPRSKRAVHECAMRAGWQFRETTGRGGQRREYHVDSLPTAARAALAGHSAQGTVAGADDVENLAHVAAAGTKLKAQWQAARREEANALALATSIALSDPAQRRMDARLEVLRTLEQFQHRAKLPITLAEYRFASAYAEGTVGVAPWVREEVGEVSPRTLQRWRLAIRRAGITALAGAYGNRKGASIVDTQERVREFVAAFLVAFPHARATHVFQGIKARLASDIANGRIRLPSVRSVGRWAARWRSENKQTLMALKDPDRWKNKFMVAYGSHSEVVTRINQRWELDSTQADVMLTDGRHSLIGVIDVATRRARLLVAKTSKATAVAQLLRGALLEWGVCEEAKTDNGSDYTSRHIARVFAALGVRHTLCPPFQPWHKPHIERFFGTFTRGLLELLPGYIGHNVAERNAIEARKSFADRLMKRGEVVEVKMNAADFQAFCDRWVDDIYLHEPHAGLGGVSPFRAAASQREGVRTINDERVLDVLLAEAAGSDGGYVTVQKQGIKADRAWFIAPELEAFVGTRVLALQLPDLGRIAVYGGDDGFICIAECPERTGISRKDVAAKARVLQTERVQRERRALKEAARKVGTDSVVEEILRERAVSAGKLACLPARRVEHNTAAIAAAGATVAAMQRERAAADPSTPARRTDFDGRHAGFPQGFETPHERASWLVSEATGRALTSEESAYVEAFKRRHGASYWRMVRALDLQATIDEEHRNPVGARANRVA